MTRKPLSYGVLNIGAAAGQEQLTSEDVSPAETADPQTAPDAHFVKHRAQQVMLYMRPEAHKALSRYALEKSSFRNKIKPHDLLVEAIQEWFDRNGLREQVKVYAEKVRR